MEMYDVKIPDENEFDLSSYTPHYDGILIALDKEGDAIGYISYPYDEEVIVLRRTNYEGDEDYVFTSFRELFSYWNKHKKIYSLKLIKFR